MSKALPYGSYSAKRPKRVSGRKIVKEPEDSTTVELRALEEEEKKYQEKVRDHRIESVARKLWFPYFLRRYLGLLSPILIALGVFLGFRGMLHGKDLIGFTWLVWIIGGAIQCIGLGFATGIIDEFSCNTLWDDSVLDNARSFATEIVNHQMEREKEKREYLDLSTNAELRQAKIELLISAKKDPRVLLEMRQAGLL